MTNNIIFSIVIPTYNRAGFIGATLDSVLAQTYPHLEVLVVDDGSRDHTAEVLSRYTDSRVHYLPKENAERGAARNYGLARATGEYVVFLDSDDLFHPNHLSTLHAAIVATSPKPNFIATKYDFDRDGVLAPSDTATLPEGWYGLDTFVRGNALACNICVRRQNPGLHRFEEDRSYAAVEDWMFMLENMQHDRVYLVDAVTLTMNDHDQRSMRSDNSALVRRLQLALEWMLRRVQLSADQRRILQGRVYYLCAIHTYADGHRSESVAFAFKAVAGLSKGTASILLFRTLLGVKLFDYLKKILLRSDEVR